MFNISVSAVMELLIFNLCLQVHAHIISYLKQEMPSVFRKDNKKKNLIYQLPVIFSKIQLQHHISAGDFPDCAKMQACL